MSTLAGPDQANAGALLGGEVQVSNVLPLGPRDGLTLNDPFRVSLRVTIALAYLGANGVDVGAVVSRVKGAISSALSATSTTATVTSAEIAELATAVGGVTAADRVVFGGGPFVSPVDGSTIPGATSFTGAGGSEPYVLAANSVVVDARIA